MVASGSPASIGAKDSSSALMGRAAVQPLPHLIRANDPAPLQSSCGAAGGSRAFLQAGGTWFSTRAQPHTP